MSEADPVNGTSGDVVDRSIEAAEEDAATPEIGQLDEEASALLKELEDSQLEVQRMLETQRAQAEELGDMKDHLSAELLQLKDDAWKLHLFAELEMLKRQLAAINSLDADLDAMEARLDAEEAGEGEGQAPVDDEFSEALAAARAGTRDLLAKLGGPASTSAAAEPAGTAAAETATAATSTSAGGGDADASAAAAKAEGGEGDDDEVGDVSALQDALDAELAAMMQQLQAIKAESAMVAARKAQLEMELMQLMRDEADDLSSQLRDLGVGAGVGDEDGEGAAPGALAAVPSAVPAPVAAPP